MRTAERQREYDRKYRTTNRDKINAMARARTAIQSDSARARTAAWTREWRKTHKENLRAAHRKQAYGLTRDALGLLLAAQDGHCALCPKPLSGGRETHVDHDHETGKVRGLLCPKHNTSLGGFGDSVDELRGAIAYLEREV